jgi:hypothetical protein
VSEKAVFKGLSKRARDLLSGGEDRLVDYKEKLNGLHAEDLIAFANSEKGGAILIGVREISQPNGRQVGEPIGVSIDDESKLQIVSKALLCSPPVQAQVFVENLDQAPFFRIEIPSGSRKPHSTSNGTYKIREDGRNDPLLPAALLKMFVESEGAEFRRRFAEATGGLQKEMTKALGLVENLEDAISSRIREIGDTLGWAEYKAGDASDTIDTVQQQVAKLVVDSKKQAKRIKAIVQKVGADDPVKREAEEEVLGELTKKLEAEPKVVAAARDGKSISVSISGSNAEEIGQGDLERLFREALATVGEKNRGKGEKGPASA